MDLREKLISNLQRNNVLSQKGLIEMFDSTIGRSTVLMPFGVPKRRCRYRNCLWVTTLPIPLR